MNARCATTDVVLNGENISVYVNRDLISLTYTDNEEDEADDLQIKVLDREGNWVQKWLNTVISDAAESGEFIVENPDADSEQDTSISSGGSGGSGNSGSSGTSYKVTSPHGVVMRSSASSKGKYITKLSCGTIIDVQSFSDEWAKVTYGGNSGWVKSKNLELVGSSGDADSDTDTYTAKRFAPMKTQRNAPVTYSGGGTNNNGNWQIGDEVIVSGCPQYDSWGIGKPGIFLKEWRGKVSNLNLKDGIPYPICVDYLGWYALDQVQKVGGEGNNNADSTKPDSRGLKVTVAIICDNRLDDGKSERFDCGEFELDAVTVDGPPQTVTIKATSLPYSNSIRQTIKSKSWENTNLSAIASEIAAQNGMGVMFDSSFSPNYDRIEQRRTSDIAFLSKLCHDAGASLKITDNVIIIFDQSEYEDKPSIRTIKFKDGSYVKYRLSTGTNSTYTCCHVSYTTPGGVVIEATEYAENYREDNGKAQCLEIRQKVGSIAEAQTLAHKMLRLHNKYEYEADFTFPGDPALAAGCVVTLEDFGAWNGRYIIKQARHNISDSGYTTQIKLRKALAKEEERGSGGAAGSGSLSDEQLNELALAVIRGEWDNGQARIDKLTAAGYDYDTVQDRVNQILYG